VAGNLETGSAASFDQGRLILEQILS